MWIRESSVRAKIRPALGPVPRAIEDMPRARLGENEPERGSEYERVVRSMAEDSAGLIVDDFRGDSAFVIHRKSHLWIILSHSQYVVRQCRCRKLTRRPSQYLTPGLNTQAGKQHS